MAVIAWDGTYPIIDGFSVRTVADVLRYDIKRKSMSKPKPVFDGLDDIMRDTEVRVGGYEWLRMLGQI